MTDAEIVAQLQSIKDRIIILESHAATPAEKTGQAGKVIGATVGSVVAVVVVWLLILLVVVATRWALR